jgi:ADP-ribosyl-[dinitrogen reductase] hydrolase
VGDAVGTTLEFRARDTTLPLTDMVGGGPFGLRPGQWTDDTAMALALADSLAIHPDLDEHDLMARFVDWHERGTYSCTGTCFDVGGTTRAALARWRTTGNPVAGSTDPRSAGNGSLMRLAPAAVRHWADRTTLRDVAARQSRTTHAAPEAVDACVAYAELLADAIAGARRSEVMRERADVVGMAASFDSAGARSDVATDGRPPRSTPLAGAIAPILAAPGAASPAWPSTLRATWPTPSRRPSGAWAAPAAFARPGCAPPTWARTPTSAAVTGQFAGAPCGAGRIQGDLQERVA